MDLKNKGEFGFIDLIKEHFKAPEGVLGIGDDCAVMPCGEGELIYSTDMLMEGVHFLRDAASPEDIGWKSLAVNLSDIAAMGGVPQATFLSIALPKDAQGEWAERFIEGYAGLSHMFNVPLLGGDTTSSLRDVAINVGVLGRVPSGGGLRRSRAVAGQGIYVTGNLGDSAGGLKAILNGWENTPEVLSLIRAHHRPLPRISEGRKLAGCGMVGAMMDISDGTASDLRHILKASGVGAEVYLDKIPVSECLKTVCSRHGLQAEVLAVSGGEDYELLFTAHQGIEDRLDFPVYQIGKITSQPGLRWLMHAQEVDMDITGYRHF